MAALVALGLAPKYKVILARTLRIDQEVEGRRSASSSPVRQVPVRAGGGPVDLRWLFAEYFDAQKSYGNLSPMPDSQKQGGNSQTLCVEIGDRAFEAVEQDQGHATVIRFQLLNQSINIGDVLVVLDGSEVRFHGMIGAIEDGGWAVAADRRGSTIPTTTQ